MRPPGSPTSIPTSFGWVLVSLVESQGDPCQIATHHASLITGDDLLCKFWKVEEGPGNHIDFYPEEQKVVSHFKENHHRSYDG